MRIAASGRPRVLFGGVARAVSPPPAPPRADELARPRLDLHGRDRPADPGDEPEHEQHRRRDGDRQRPPVAGEHAADEQSARGDRRQAHQPPENARALVGPVAHRGRSLPERREKLRRATRCDTDHGPRTAQSSAARLAPIKSSMAHPPAKRRVLRPPLRIECARAAGRKNHFLGYGADVSETGVFVQSLAPRPPGTRLRLVMHFSAAGSRADHAPTQKCVGCAATAGSAAPSRGHGHALSRACGPRTRVSCRHSAARRACASAADIQRPIRNERRTSG